jgi:hypothetical protein
VQRKSTAIMLTLVGLLAICIGLLIPFLDIYTLESTFIGIIGFGVILSFIGTVMWSWSMARSRRGTVSATLLLVGFGFFALAGSNIHIWGLFFLVAIPTVLLGLVVLVMAISVRKPNTIR